MQLRELMKALERERVCVERDMSVLKGICAISTEEWQKEVHAACRIEIIQEKKRELRSIADRVERVLLLLGKQTRAETDAGCLESAMDQKRTHDHGYDWLRRKAEELS